MANIGKNIRQLRIRNNMKQEDLAEKLYVSRQTISNYETGKSHPGIDMMIKIADVLETDVNALIYGDEIQKEQKRRLYLQIVRIIGIVLLGIILRLIENKVTGNVNLAGSERTNYWWEIHISYDIKMFLDYGLFPLFSVIVGWQVMEIICLVFQKETIKWKYTDIIHRIAKIILYSYNVIMLPFWIYEIRSSIDYWKWETAGGEGYWSSSYDFLPIWDDIVMEIQYFGWENAVIFIILFLALGAVIRMTGRKEKKNETTLHEKI